MVRVTMNITAVDDTQIDSWQPTFNFGATNPFTCGRGAQIGQYLRTLMRFNIPEFDGTLVSQTLMLTIVSAGNTTPKIFSVHIVESPQDDLWIEGTSNGALDSYGVSWQRYAAGLNWAAAGGDFDTEPIVLYQHSNYVGGVALAIPLDNFKFSAGKSYTVLIKLTEETTIAAPNYITFNKGTSYLSLAIERSTSIVAPVLSVIPSTAMPQRRLIINWEKPAINYSEFSKYELWYSDTGAFAGEQLLLTTITDINVVSYASNVLVGQSDIHDYDHTLDTYPNGRTQYFKIILYTNGLGTYTSTRATGTTLPMARSFKLVFTPRSKDYEKEFSDNNQIYKPYGVRVGIEFLSDETPIEQISRMLLDCYYKTTGAGWPALPNETGIFDYVDGVQIEGDIGYAPYRINGSIITIGSPATRLYRKACTGIGNIFVDNFDTGETVGAIPTKWTAGAIIDNTQFYSSPNSMKVNGVTSHLTSGLKYITNIHYLVKTTTQLNSQLAVGVGLNAVFNNHIVAVNFSSGGVPPISVAYWNYATTNWINVPAPFAINTWYDVEFKINFMTLTYSVSLKDMSTGVRYIICTGIPFSPSLASGIYLIAQEPLSSNWYIDNVCVTQEQFEVCLPAPCPVAIPRGKTNITVPPDFYPSPASGGLLFSDLKYAAQQSGDNIFKKDLTVVLPDVWFTRMITGVGTVSIIGNAIKFSTLNTIGIAEGAFAPKLNDYSTVPAEFNVASQLSKYTGAYNINTTMKIEMGSGTYNIGDKAGIGFCGWSNYAIPYQLAVGAYRSSHGYKLIMINEAVNKGFWLVRAKPLYTHTAPFYETLMTAYALGGGADNPLNPATYNQFLHFEITISPLFDSTGVLIGDRILIVYKKNATQSVAETIDWDTHPYVWIIDSVNRDVGDQMNYTGVINFGAYNTVSNSVASVLLHEFKINGKVKTPQIPTSGFGLKNETSGETYPMGTTTPTGFPIFCKPDQASQTIYLEGRIKNEFGAQSPNTTWSGQKGSTLFQGGVINNIIPVAFLSVSKVGFTGSDTLINCSQSVDPEGGTLIYEIDFGDGTTSIGVSPIVTKQYSTTGIKTIKLKVKDEAGLYSVEVQTDINILNAVDQFQEITIMSPWISISETSPTGTSVTSHPEVDYDTVQTMPGGNRVFSIKGIHESLDCTITEAQRMALAESEKEYFQYLKNHGVLITLDLEFFGKVKGVITEHGPSMDAEDQGAFGFSMTFQEVRLEQFEV